MRRRVIIRPAARDDLDQQAEYLYLRAGLEVAVRFQECVAETFQLLLRQPKMGKPTRLRNPLFASARELPLREFEKHIVFYRPTYGGIEVLRVIHGARDIEALVYSSLRMRPWLASFSATLAGA